MSIWNMLCTIVVGLGIAAMMAIALFLIAALLSKILDAIEEWAEHINDLGEKIISVISILLFIAVIAIGVWTLGVGMCTKLGWCGF